MRALDAGGGIACKHPNFRDIYEVKKSYPRNLDIASLTVESKRESWHEMLLEQVPKSRESSVLTP
jgi:hypothetical protein